LQVTGESVFRRMAQVVGLGQDIELESEDFNRAFTVTSRDPKFATDVLTPRTMQMLLNAPHLAWRIEGTDVLSWESGSFTTVEVLQRLDHLSKVVAGVPSFVWHDHGYDPPQSAQDAGGGSSP
jgi:protein gp37